jgi:hypothetical protein
VACFGFSAVFVSRAGGVARRGNVTADAGLESPFLLPAGAFGSSGSSGGNSGGGGNSEWPVCAAPLQQAPMSSPESSTATRTILVRLTTCLSWFRWLELARKGTANSARVLPGFPAHPQLRQPVILAVENGRTISLFLYLSIDRSNFTDFNENKAEVFAGTDFC